MFMHKISVIFLMIVLCVKSATAAMTFDTSAESAASTSDPLTLSYTCGANAKLLVLAIASATTTPRTGGAPTYNGRTMFQVNSTQVGSAECTAELWYLPNPTTGSAVNISVPNAGALTLRLADSSYNSNNNVIGLDVDNVLQGSGANPSLDVTTHTDGGVIVDSLCDGNNNDPTANSQTLLFENDNGSWSNNSQYALQAIRGTITFSYTAGSDDVAFIVGAFAEAGESQITGTSNVQGDSVVW